MGRSAASTPRRKTGRRRGSLSHSSASSLEDPPESITDYIPPYLRKVIFPYHGDFCYSPYYHPKLLVQLMAEGFLPMATRGYLLPKLHQDRCVIRLRQHSDDDDSSTMSSLHVRKSTRKKLKKFRISVNQCFDDVVRGCRDQHDHCWLYPQLTSSFRRIHDPTVYNTPMTAGVVLQSNSDKTLSAVPVRLYSIEVFDMESSTLVAGELGYSVGSIYTSLTGFSVMNSAGSVQMAALGHLLQQHGFTLWDLGMDMEYKREMGALPVPRTEFVAHVRRARGSRVSLPTITEAISCSKSAVMYGESTTNRSVMGSHDQEEPRSVSQAEKPQAAVMVSQRTQAWATSMPSEPAVDAQQSSPLVARLS